MTITLATLKDATKQQIFDQVARHLLRQGERAVDAVGRCKYRTESGLKCAAGCLISDEEYTPDFDKHGSWGGVIMAGYVSHDQNSEFIAALQRMHDNDGDGVEPDFESRLARFVNWHNKRYPSTDAIVFDPVKLMAPEPITLATLPQATEQEVFDQISKHLLKQMRRSESVIDGASKCRYRGDEGVMCAAGCLIADNEYTPAMDRPRKDEGTAWRDLLRNKLVPDAHFGMIRSLQIVHDTEPPELWEEKLREYAFINKLTFFKDVK